ncbi:MAG: substrate-binding domain-containing protein [Acidobacteriota bacterium]
MRSGSLRNPRQSRFRIRPCLYPALALVLVSSVPVWLFAESVVRDSPDVPSYSWILIPALALVWLLALTLTRRVKPGTSPRPIAPVDDLARSLVTEDCRALTIAMTELAQGNLTAQLAVRSKPLDPAAYPEARDYIGLLNSIVASLQETAVEFNSVTEIPCHRFCYVGADSFLEGRACAEAMGEALNRAGKVAVVNSIPTAAGPGVRRKGFISAIHERYPGIEIVTTIQATENPDIAFEATQKLLQEYPNLQGLYVTAGATPHAVARAVIESGRQGQIKIVGHDLVDETMRDVQQGIITATLGQDPFAQGHEPVIHLYNYLAAGWRPPAPRLLTKLDIVTRQNYEQFWHPDRGTIETEAVAARRSSPLPSKSTRPLRLAVLGREDSKYWDTVRDGVMAAAEKLRPYNVTVDWLVPPENRANGDISAEVYGPLLDSVVAQRYDGLATGVFHKDYIPYINRAVASGVPVVTFNSEPTSLRGLVFAIAEQAQRLMGMSQGLAATINGVNQSTIQINSAMNQVSRGTIAQNEQVSQTHEALGALLRNIDEVSSEATKGSAAAENAARAAQAGAQAVEKTLASMQAIKDSVSDTARTVQGLGEHSQKIDIIIKLIGGIAYQIKLLGINAAIEAAHAGQYGAGFLVVAGEIRSLAERTAQATREITTLVDSVQSQVREVQKVMGSGLDKVAQGATLAEQAGKVLSEIREAAEANLTRLKAINEAMTEMQSFSHQVGGVMESVAAISEENAAAVQQVTASTKEMTAQLLEVTETASALARMAESEQELLAKFNLSGS